MKRLRVRGAAIEYVVEGSGPPVLLTHGALVADAMIVPLAGQPALTSCHRLIGYRRRGYAAGGSGDVVNGTTLAGYAADAAALLEHLGVSRAHAVGHSSGALISLQLAHDRPDLVGSLALLEPPLASPEAFRAHGEEVLRPALERYSAGDRDWLILGTISRSSVPISPCSPGPATRKSRPPSGVVAVLAAP